MTDVNLDCSDAGISLQAMDTAHVALVRKNFLVYPILIYSTLIYTLTLYTLTLYPCYSVRFPFCSKVTGSKATDVIDHFQLD